jgi:hypothetical protein
VTIRVSQCRPPARRRYVEELGLRANERVSTKSLNASDASTSAAGDVQHVAGGQVLEAYEVTANDWRTKVDQAIDALRTHDLARGYGEALRRRGLTGEP